MQSNLHMALSFITYGEILIFKRKHSFLYEEAQLYY